MHLGGTRIAPQGRLYCKWFFFLKYSGKVGFPNLTYLVEMSFP